MEQYIEYKWVFTMVIKTYLGILWVILGSEKNLIVDILNKVENCFTALNLLVVPIYNCGFVACVNVIVIDILAKVDGRRA